jgi:DNA-binding NarL/FixJ family response regulator
MSGVKRDELFGRTKLNKWQLRGKTMNKDKPMPLLLVEDDVAECIKFKDCANTRTDITFIAMTGSGKDALEYVKTRLPEGVILDLELHRGKGSGLQFLADLKTADLALRPIVIVTTNSPSSLVYNHVHDMGADLVFYKRQSDYGPEMVVNTLLALRKSLHTVKRDGLPGDLQTIESPEEQRVRIMKRICTELDLVGIGIRYKGRAYIEESIFLLLSRDKDTSESILYQVAERKRLSYSSVIRAIQTAINKAWDSSSIEDLAKYYTARISIKTGVPSPTEFIYYYADRIRKTM